MDARKSGVLLHITSLPTDYGIGDLGPAAYRFADFLAEAGQRYWQVLPLNPTSPVQGESPYSSISAFALNPLIVSPELLLQDGLIDAEDLDPGISLPEARVSYDDVRGYKNRLLEKAFERFKNARNSNYEGFIALNSHWLEDFVTFLAVKENFGGQSWDKWPFQIRDRDQTALEEIRNQMSDRIEYHKFVQFILFKQWHDLKRYCNSKGIKIIGDLPIYVSYDSCDVWSAPQIFKLDGDRRPIYVAGVPPDYFSQTGQLWGNPVYDWEECKRENFKWWLRRIGHQASLFDIIRIDHFRGLVAYWEVPATEQTAVNGRWVEAPAYDFFATVLEHYKDVGIIAEDLGMITPDVHEVMHYYGFPGMKVLLFAFGEENPKHPYLPHNYERNCVVYTGTHDNNTCRGWFRHEASEEEKSRLAKYIGCDVNENNVHWHLIRLAMSSVANAVIFPMQDLLGLGEEARMNVPSRPTGNWLWKLEKGQIDQGLSGRLFDLTRTYGRV